MPVMRWESVGLTSNCVLKPSTFARRELGVMLHIWSLSNKHTRFEMSLRKPVRNGSMPDRSFIKHARTSFQC
eukprot:7086274-Alexandrium_andersonii.AAC.1